ncbi:hypothetical protein [Terrabacter terrigena]|uniref:Gram-positive cocci surface proteins LPxTG domain-containing protein n=1 Tax=Terrabacter terrigena TaxID=574718 RepID=A0ABW3N005_9MICO
MSSQSSTTSSGLGRRSAAALGASAVLSLALAGPALAQQPWEPSPKPVPPAATECTYMGGGSIVECREARLFPKQSLTGSANVAERGIPATPVAPATPKIKVPLGEPTNLPVVGIGAATAAVLAGGVALVAASRRRPARPA